MTAFVSLVLLLIATVMLWAGGCCYEERKNGAAAFGFVVGMALLLLGWVIAVWGGK